MLMVLRVLVLRMLMVLRVLVLRMLMVLRVLMLRMLMVLRVLMLRMLMVLRVLVLRGLVMLSVWRCTVRWVTATMAMWVHRCIPSPQFMCANRTPRGDGAPCSPVDARLTKLVSLPRGALRRHSDPPGGLGFADRCGR